MEGMGIAKEVAGLVTAIGIVPTLIIVAVIVFFVLREFKKQVSGVGNSIDRLRAENAERDEKIIGRVESLEQEVKFVQRDYITKAEHYQDTEGWKTEIQGIRQEVAKLPLEILKLTNMKKE